MDQIWSARVARARRTEEGSAEAAERMWPVGVRRRRVETGGEREEDRRVVSGLVRSIVWVVFVVVCSAEMFWIWTQRFG